MGMSERERHIKVLEQFLHDYQEWGEDLELEKTIKYAISSLKTDLKYDLMYEGEDVFTKADMIAMFTELQDELKYTTLSGLWKTNYAEGFNDSVATSVKKIQCRIDKLKENK